jgi:5-methylcytosine-specific restriction endonuclease McrA
MNTKKCSVCSQKFLATTEFFYRRGSSLHAKCKICYNQYQAKKQSTPEAKLKRSIRLSSQREHINTRQRKYYADNREKWNEYYKARDRANPEAALARVHKRRARKLHNGAEPYTRQNMLDTYGSNCYLCGLPINLSVSGKVGSSNWENGLHIEHVIPLSAGGTDKLENVRPSHGRCNLDKGTK